MKIAKRSFEFVKHGVVLTGWVTKVVTIGLIKTTSIGIKTTGKVYKRYKLGKKQERLSNE